MEFFDWLLGNSRIGWWKTARLSGLLGLIILGLTFGYEYESSGTARGLVILTGVVPVIVIRTVYWSWRRKKLWEGIRRDDQKAWSAAIALFWRRPSLEPEFREATRVHMEIVRAWNAEQTKGRERP